MNYQMISTVLFVIVIGVALSIKVHFWFTFYYKIQKKAGIQESQWLEICGKDCKKLYSDDLFNETWCYRSCYEGFASKVMRTYTCVILVMAFKIFYMKDLISRSFLLTFLFMLSFNTVVTWESLLTVSKMYTNRVAKEAIIEYRE